MYNKNNSPEVEAAAQTLWSSSILGWGLLALPTMATMMALVEV